MRGTICRYFLFAGLTVAIVAGTAMAQSSGKEDYARDCAECHGADGKGAQAEKRAVPGYISINLTQISKRNGGEFPRQEVVDAIDGSHRIAAHFRGDMPRWGAEYSLGGDAKAAHRARARISALVDFIASIQEK
jgi:mono/diheme cytochrome c family protein